MTHDPTEVAPVVFEKFPVKSAASKSPSTDGTIIRHVCLMVRFDETRMSAASSGSLFQFPTSCASAALARFLLIHGYSMSPVDGHLRTTISVVARFHLRLAAASPQILMAGPRASVLSMRSQTASSHGSSSGTPITAHRPVLCRLLFPAC